jgi:hypothetical protein
LFASNTPITTTSNIPSTIPSIPQNSYFTTTILPPHLVSATTTPPRNPVSTTTTPLRNPVSTTTTLLRNPSLALSQNSASVTTTSPS